MYWNNPNQFATPAHGPDLVAQSQHHGQHCLFYDPAVPLSNITKLITLQQTCDLANQYLHCLDAMTEPGDIDKVANVVRINQFVHSLRKNGNVKPMLLNYTGTWPLGASTGGSRVMAAERTPEIQSFSAFISTHQQHQHHFQHLERIETLQQFAKYCGAHGHSQFVFRLTDADADYGLDWYEVSLDTVTVPNNQQCLDWLKLYLAQQSNSFEFTPEWFDQEINWTALDHH